jgi:hypothetical protein
VIAQRTNHYQKWVEAFGANHQIPIQWAEKGVRKEDYVLPWLRRMRKKNAYGVYFIFKSMEQGPTFRVSVPKYSTKDPNHRILAPQRSRFTHFYFYIYDQVLGPMVMRVASFLPFQATYYLNGHSFIEQELRKAQIRGTRKISFAAFYDPCNQQRNSSMSKNGNGSTRKRGVTDGKAEDATRQPEQVRAFRDTWKLGIHSYLAYGCADRSLWRVYRRIAFYSPPTSIRTARWPSRKPKSSRTSPR